MSNLTRWTPFRDVLRMQEDLNRLLDASMRGYAPEEQLSGSWVPPVDIFEDEDGVLLKMDVPELTANDIELQIENGTLTIKGERKLEKADRKDRYTRVERFHGTFVRSFALPNTVNPEKVVAEAKNGVLRVFLPRREETKPRQIRVNVT